MNIPSPESLVAAPRAGDAGDGIGDDLPCHCGYNLRGLSERGACPECGRSVSGVLGDLEQASLDGRARRRMGASLLLAGHLVWLSMMGAWLLNVRSELRLALPMLALAGQRSVASLEALRPGTIRTFGSTVVTLLVLHLIGLWMLTTVKPRERLDGHRWAGAVLWAVQVAAVGVAGMLLAIPNLSEPSLLISLHLLELPVAIVFGVYLARLGTTERSRPMMVAGRTFAALLSLGNALIAFSVFRWWVFDPPPPLFYVGLALNAVAGVLLLALLVRLRILLGREPA